MKKVMLALAAAALLPLAASAQATWKSDAAHSQLGFTIAHLGISEISGAFNQFEVTITASKPDFSDAVFQLTTEVASIDTAVGKRDDHLRSADFFNVARHSRMTFTSKSITPTGNNRYQLAGELTIHGVTKSVTAQLWYRGTTSNQGKTTAGFQLTATLRRSDFDVGPKFAPPMIADEFTVKANGEFIKQ